jgi:hypothetical protein
MRPLLVAGEEGLAVPGDWLAQAESMAERRAPLASVALVVEAGPMPPQPALVAAWGLAVPVMAREEQGRPRVSTA